MTSVSKWTENGLCNLPFLPQSIKSKEVYNKSINPILQSKEEERILHSMEIGSEI